MTVELAIVAFSLAVIAFELLLGARAMMRVLACRSFSSGRGPESRSQGDPPRILILIPCLDEQERIEGTLVAVCDEFRKLLPIVAVVTCLREEAKGGARTRDVVLRARRERSEAHDDIRVIEYPGGGYMADQLNYAIEEIGDDWEYCLVYNADSRPSPGTADAFRAEMETGNPVIQQYSAMTANVASLSPVMKGFALYQTNYELKTGYLGLRIPSILSAPHVVGHGLALRADVVRDMMFNTEHWCEDIYMSFSLHNRGIGICTLPVLESCGAPESVRAQIVQHSVWFKTAGDIGGVARTEFRDRAPSVRGIRYLVQRSLRSLMWLVSPMLMALSVVLPALAAEWRLAAFALVAYCVMCALEYGSTILLVWLARHDREEVRQLGRGLLAIGLVRLISCAGPWASFFAKEKARTPFSGSGK